MQDQLKEIAQRIKALREIMEIPVGELARENGVTAEEYLEYESGEKDFTFTFLYNCAQLFGVDIIELLTGEKPRLSSARMRDSRSTAARALPITILPIAFPTRPPSRFWSPRLSLRRSRISRSTFRPTTARNLTTSSRASSRYRWRTMSNTWKRATRFITTAATATG